jgi:hypothetical protein
MWIVKGHNKSVVMALATALAMGILVVLVVNEILSPRGFAVCSVFVMAVAAAIWFLVLKSARKIRSNDEPVGSPQIRDSGYKKVFVAIALAVFLAFSLWGTRGGPWLPRLIGSCFLVALIIGNLLRKPSRDPGKHSE